MTTPTKKVTADSGAAAAAGLAPNARFLSTILATRYNPRKGFAVASRETVESFGIADRSFRDTVRRLEDAGVWRVERTAGKRSQGYRFYPLFIDENGEAK